MQTFPQFLALRSLFGIGMGGIWGLASATALENLPVEARGLASGIMQQGYAVGYLIAALVNLYLVPSTSWRSLFWTGAGISAFAAALRALLPESEVFLRARREKQNTAEESTQSKTRIFFHEVGQMLKKHWLLCIYAVLLMSGFNFLSHGSQDLYPTYLQESKGFSKFDATVATIIGNCGAISYVVVLPRPLGGFLIIVSSIHVGVVRSLVSRVNTSVAALRSCGWFILADGFHLDLFLLSDFQHLCPSHRTFHPTLDHP